MSAVLQAHKGAKLSVTLQAREAILLLSCPERRGVAATLSQALYARGAHVIESDQHTDLDSQQYFQRLRVDLSELQGSEEQLLRELGEVAAKLGMQCDTERRSRARRVAIFVSKYDHCLYDLLLKHRAGELDCDIPLIVSNHPDLEPTARQFGVDFVCISGVGVDKASAESRQQNLLQERDIDLVVLARYMQILSPEFATRWAGRAINIHHSFLPAFAGGRPYHQARARGVKLIGATAHFATPDLDEGPIIEQDVVRCSHRDSIDELVRKGRDLEKLVLSRAVRWYLGDRVLVHDNRTVVFS